MSARYLFIRPDNEPYDLPADDKGRPRIVFSVSIKKTASEQIEEELLGRLVARGVGTLNVNLFGSSSASLPTGEGPYLSVSLVGGPGPEYLHNSDVPAYQRPTARFTVRASSYRAARQMARAAYDALANVRNMTLSPIVG